MSTGLDPFYVFFGVPLQKEFLLTSTSHKPVRLAFDATGIDIAPPLYSSMSTSTSGGKYKKSFLYLISLQTDTVNVPIFQVISQRHSHEFIEYMLRYFQERFLNGKQPSQMTMDDSAALALASVRAFTPYKSMMEYHDACYDSLFDKSIPPPPLEIKLDRSHFVKFIQSCKALKEEKDTGKVKFYQRILGFLILSTDIAAVESVIENMFILLKNEYLHSDRVIAAKDDLKSIVQTHKQILTETPKNYVEVDEFDEERELNSSNKSKFYNWVQKIADSVDAKFVNQALNDSIEDTDAERNPYFSKQLIKQLMKIVSRIHLFSFVMNSTFGSKIITPSSSCTEAQFRTIKSYIFQNKKGQRLDTWLERSIEITTGNFKALVAETNEASKASKQKKTEKSSASRTESQLDMAEKEMNVEEDCQMKQQKVEKLAKDIAEKYRPLEENWRNRNVDVNPNDARHVPTKAFRSKNSILNPERFLHDSDTEEWRQI